jgi:CTP synthase
MRDKLSMFCNVPVKAVIEAATSSPPSTSCRSCSRRRAWTSWWWTFARLKNRPEEEHLGRDRPPHQVAPTRGHHRRGRQVHRAAGRLQVRLRVDHPRGHRQHAAGERARIDAEDLEKKGGMAVLLGLDGILVPGGFGDRGTEGKDRRGALRPREKIPYYGLCLGLQIAVIEIRAQRPQAEAGPTAPSSTRSAGPGHQHDGGAEGSSDKGATMRLGSYDCALTPARWPRRPTAADASSASATATATR